MIIPAAVNGPPFRLYSCNGMATVTLVLESVCNKMGLGDEYLRLRSGLTSSIGAWLGRGRKKGNGINWRGSSKLVTNKADSFEPAEWYKRQTSRQSRWLGTAAVGLIPGRSCLFPILQKSTKRFFFKNAFTRDLFMLFIQLPLSSFPCIGTSWPFFFFFFFFWTGGLVYITALVFRGNPGLSAYVHERVCLFMFRSVDREWFHFRSKNNRHLHIIKMWNEKKNVCKPLIHEF